MEKAQRYLAERMIPEWVAAAGHMAVTDNAQEMGEKFFDRGALVLPYHEADGTQNGFFRLRYFEPPEVGGVRKKTIRYQQPAGTAPDIYLPQMPGFDWREAMANPEQPLIITEGEAKSCSVMVNTTIPTMGLGGVFMFADNKVMLPKMEATNWNRRRVYIVFDSDIDSKIGVQLAEARLAQWLLRRRAIVHTCRLPPAPDGEKQGADDFIAAYGAEAFKAALQSSRSLSDLDLRVLELNSSVAWLDGEEKLIELDSGQLIRKDSFISGSRFSTLTVPMQDGDKIKNVSVARTWLNHPMATRYVNTIFLPGAGEVVSKPDGTYLNTWKEPPCKEGDVSMFLDLTKYLFEDTLGEDWQWPIRLLAYKAQHQTYKIPLAIMLIGGQGSGKSLWADLAKAAFGRYSASKNGKDLNQDWNGFIENSLFVVIDDVSSRQMRANIEMLRAWISNPRIDRVEKYLKNREVDNYALFVFTSNHRDAGAFAHDDRRFLVVGAPKRDRDADYYGPIFEWLRSGVAGANIYNYLLAYDLDGWTPPIQAPITAEKRMAYEESLSAFEKLARDMQTSDANVVETWLSLAEQWAVGVLGSPGHSEAPRANDILLAIQAFPIRPWYTAEELCNMFPHMLAELDRQERRWNRATLPGKVSTALRNNGIYFLRNTDDAEGFMWKGRRQQFLVICPGAGYPKAMSQGEFDALMRQMTNYKPRLSRSLA